jgi:hypothetical protein
VQPPPPETLFFEGDLLVHASSAVMGRIASWAREGGRCCKYRNFLTDWRLNLGALLLRSSDPPSAFTYLCLSLTVLQPDGACIDLTLSLVVLLTDRPIVFRTV